MAVGDGRLPTSRSNTRQAFLRLTPRSHARDGMSVSILLSDISFPMVLCGGGEKQVPAFHFFRPLLERWVS
jgi:hypothetical protein